MDALANRLHRFVVLTPNDATALERALADKATYHPHTDIVRDGAVCDYALAILSGWACRYKILKNGSRQITSLLMAGDFCHLNSHVGQPMDHAIAPLSEVIAARVPRSEQERIIHDCPNLTRALIASQVADEARLRSSIISLGRQDARERVGHLLCELWTRADCVYLIDDDGMDFPITQTDIADRVGLTPVHANRVLQSLRRDRLLNWTRPGRLLLPDFPRLAALSGYESGFFGVVRDQRWIRSNGRETMNGGAALA